MKFIQAVQQRAKEHTRQLVDLCLLVLAFFGAYTLSPLVVQPFKNPYNISNPLNSTGFSPESNFYIIAFVVIGSLGLFWLFRYLYYGKHGQVLKALIILLLLVNYLFVAKVPALSYLDTQGVLDNFHAGEELSGGSELLGGKEPYRDMFFLRGAGVDAVIPAIVFSLFGRSIGAFILSMDALEFLALVSFAVLLACFIKNPLKYAAILGLFYISAATSLIQFRDVFAWLVVGLLFLAFKPGFGLIQKRITLGAVGFISSLTLFISIDRGIMLFALAIMTMFALLVLRADKKNIYVFDKYAWKRSLDSLSVLAGILLGLAIPGLFLGVGGFADFVRMSFVEIPAYGGLLVSQSLPALLSDKYLFWAPVFVSIATGYVLIALYGTKALKNLNTLIPLSLVYIFALFCLKIGSNRIHLQKLASATAPLYLIAILVLGFAIVYAYQHRREAAKLMLPVAVSIASLIIFAQPDITKIFYSVSYTHTQLSQYKNTYKRSDDSLISAETKQVKDYIITHTTKQDYIFAYTSDPVYYYLSDRRNPSRFNISWFTDPQPYTNELLVSLKTHMPKIIIYSESTWMDAPDGIAMTERTPEVNQWILAHYPREQKIGSTTLRFQ